MLTDLKGDLWHVNVYFTEPKTKCKGELNFQGLECRNEIHQLIELEEQMKKMESFFQLPCLLPELWLSNCEEMAHFLYCLAEDSKILVAVQA